MRDEEKKRIAEYINTYRTYPDEYKGNRDQKIIYQLNRGYRYSIEEQTITRVEGEINDNGDFEIIGSFTFPIDRPEEKISNPGYVIEYLRRDFSGLLNEFGYNQDISKWTIRDIVSEAEYIRSTYYQKGHPNNALRTTDYYEWNKRTHRLRNWIRNHKGKIDGVKAYKKHGTKYDD